MMAAFPCELLFWVHAAGCDWSYVAAVPHIKGTVELSVDVKIAIARASCSY